MLLDEPTNHLDLEANLWFEKYLTSFLGGVLITSHDRTFLNQIATKVLAIETDEAVIHRGNYDDYLVARERTLQVKRAASARQEREVQKQMRFVERFRFKASKAGQVQSRFEATRENGDHQNCQGLPGRFAIHFQSPRAAVPTSYH